MPKPLKAEPPEGAEMPSVNPADNVQAPGALMDQRMIPEGDVPEGAFRVNDGLVIQNLNQKLSDANLQNSMLEAAVAQLRNACTEKDKTIADQAAVIDKLAKHNTQNGGGDKTKSEVSEDELPQVEEG